MLAKDGHPTAGRETVTAEGLSEAVNIQTTFTTVTCTTTAA